MLKIIIKMKQIFTRNLIVSSISAHCPPYSGMEDSISMQIGKVYIYLLIFYTFLNEIKFCIKFSYKNIASLR